MYILKYSDYLVPIYNPVNKPTTQCTYHHIQCTLQLSAAYSQASSAHPVHILQQPLIFSAHTTAAIASPVYIATMYSHVQLSAANLQCTLQLTAAIYNHLHYNYTIQYTLQLHYLMLIPYSASSEEG